MNYLIQGITQNGTYAKEPPLGKLWLTNEFYLYTLPRRRHTWSSHSLTRRVHWHVARQRCGVPLQTSRTRHHRGSPSSIRQVALVETCAVALVGDVSDVAWRLVALFTILCQDKRNADSVIRQHSDRSHYITVGRGNETQTMMSRRVSLMSITVMYSQDCA